LIAPRSPDKINVGSFEVGRDSSSGDYPRGVSKADLSGPERASPSPIEATRWALLRTWEDELLKGGVTLSEFSTFLVQDADLAFCAGADLAALLAAQAAMETHLRHEHRAVGGEGFAALIDRSGLPSDLTARLHEVRRYRNRWVHVADPDADSHLLAHPERNREELARMATAAMRALYEVIFLCQWT
jgi:hypothetical protein